MLNSNTDSLHLSLFTYSFSGGGAEKMMVRIANELNERGHHVELVLVDESGPFGSLVDSGIGTTEIGGRNTLEMQYYLWRYLRDTNPDLLISTMEIPNITSIVASKIGNSTPVVIRIANMNSMKERRGKYTLIPTLKALTYPHAESIISVSNDVARDLTNISNIPREEVTTIYNPSYDPEIPKQSVQHVPHDWLNDPNKCVVIGVGHLKPQKDFQTLINSINQINESRDVYLIILGEGHLAGELQTLTEDLEIADRVSFPGFVENPYAYMAKADVFVLSSAWEGCPNVLIEAMACATPVVGTDCPGGTSEILDEGKYGPLVPVGDDETMAVAIEHVLTNPPNGSRLRSRAQEFGIEPIVDTYEEILLSIAKS